MKSRLMAMTALIAAVGLVAIAVTSLPHETKTESGSTIRPAAAAPQPLDVLPAAAAVSNESAPADVHLVKPSALFFDAANYRDSVKSAETGRSRDDIGAVIVPHHLLASSLAAAALKAASGREIGRIIVVGPNHDNVGPTAIATGDVAWSTPDGLLGTDTAATAGLRRSFTLAGQTAVFDNEHSIGELAPFLRHFFPQAKLVPIVLSSYASRGQAERLAGWIDAAADERTLVVFSADFSHYLSETEADKRDVTTRRLMLAGDLDGMSRLGNDNVDSPATLVTAFALAERRGWRFEITANANANDFSEEKHDSTTSYFTGLWYRQ